MTNWEQGLFTASDVAWALRTLRESIDVVAGDLCGAYSPPRYARRGQKFVADWDHPKVSPPDPTAAQRTNLAALETIWPALTA